MEDTSKKYLPLGTVVLLKGGNKKLMIIGFCAKSNSVKDKVWDYVGCMYPEGLISSNMTYMFNNENIEKVFYWGLTDEEEKSFKKNLDKAMDIVNNQLTKDVKK